MNREYLYQVFMAAIGVWGFAVLYHVPKKHYWGCIVTGTVGWLAYYIFVEEGISKVMACLIASFIVTEIARSLAVAQKVPSTVFLVIGIFPLVPGASIYYTAYNLFMRNLSVAGNRGLETFEISLAIVGGIILGSSIPKYIIGQKKR
jgi:uncharacterized membrane protein YjjB (DUF3815 family)